MLELLLFRHAKSAWDRPGQGDHDRDLVPRGEAAAPRMGELIAASNLRPDLVLCSTATRARRTWELAAGRLAAGPEVRFLRELYLASPEAMIRLVRKEGGQVRRLMLVGHNPGLHALAVGLAAAGESKLRSALAAKLPTAALVHLSFELPHWDALAARSGTLLGFWRPRDLA
jgi:phosphohistidine phosphatase